ncbi:hypothetical protein [Pseudomonas fluorescens]|uniref:hypothetical protein n=1 Tax=Pseudomonas fluorescens TaxID=294 RepID=UPI001252FA3C|nr:hypothetical protein [Pseudomonas fluorescens]VVM85449.1 hypothetical protein PS639_02492 [Pseudomonas fluorescens]
MLANTKAKKAKSTEYDYRCYHCKDPYKGRREQADKSKRFCKDACRQAKARSTKKAEKKVSRIEEQFIRWYKSTNGKYVFDYCRDAGTVGVMLGHTTASLFDLKSFNDSFYKCYGYNKDEKKSVFHRSHIQAHKGSDGSVGALHPVNLFIGESALNQGYGNRAVSSDAGLKIPASKLKSAWKVSKTDTSKAVAQKIRKLLGKEFTEYLSQSTAIEMNQVHTLAQRIYNRQQKGTAEQELDQRYTKETLETFSFEELQAFDAYQRGGEVSKFKPELYTRAALCVYLDELERMANTSPSERQRDNCRFMAGLVRVLGMFIAQAENEQGIAHKSFLPLGDMEWKPLSYLNWQQPWGKPAKRLIDADQGFLIKNLTDNCFHALAGADIPQGLLRARLLKRLDVATLVPTVLVPDGWRFKAFGSWDKFIESLHANSEPVWQALLDLGLCTPAEVEEARTGLLWSLQEALEKARHQYRNQECFKRTYKGEYHNRWGWRGYPKHLEYPPVLAGLFLPGDEVVTLPMAA